MLTFDDGYKSVLTHAYHYLAANNIPFTIYVTTAPVENKSYIWVDKVYSYLYYQNYEKIDFSLLGLNISKNYFLNNRINAITNVIKRLKEIDYQKKNLMIDQLMGFEYNIHPCFELLSIKELQFLANDYSVTIGAHTVNHEILTKMSPSDSLSEIMKSRTILEKWVGKSVEHFAYPNGGYNQNIVSIVKQAGFKSAARIGLLTNWTINPFELCRVGSGASDDDYQFYSMINGVISLKIEFRNYYHKIKGKLF